MSCITMGNTIAIQFFQDSAGQLKVGTEFIAASPSAGGTVVESLNVAAKGDSTSRFQIRFGVGHFQVPAIGAARRRYSVNELTVCL